MPYKTLSIPAYFFPPQGKISQCQTLFSLLVCLILGGTLFTVYSTELQITLRFLGSAASAQRQPCLKHKSNTLEELFIGKDFSAFPGTPSTRPHSSELHPARCEHCQRWGIHRFTCARASPPSWPSSTAQWRKWNQLNFLNEEYSREKKKRWRIMGKEHIQLLEYNTESLQYLSTVTTLKQPESSLSASELSLTNEYFLSFRDLSCSKFQLQTGANTIIENGNQELLDGQDSLSESWKK
ncbi:uncharacterized protein [Taeniopygia guttata]|uniref:uncharacterized protein n=1 Tax=Taeniopygia guttata TaxID=59729 RepID=UPI003BB8E297